MLIFDIDDTISPTRRSEAPETTGESARAGMFTIFIPDHILSVLRSREDIALLSTWGSSASSVAKAFDFRAEILDMKVLTKGIGSVGKFEIIQKLRPAGWADDHITPKMAAWCKDNGVVTSRPRKGYMLPKELQSFIAAADGRG